jgi:predicted dienelactone hydrolase
MRFITILALTTLLLVSAGCSAPVERDLKVGRLHRAFVDSERTNWAGDGPRPIAATVWYPASADSVESEWSASVFLFGTSALNAPFSDASKRPLIVLSHGTGGSAAQMSWLAEALVNAGFMVAAVSHHGNTASENRAWPHGFVLPGERARDLTVLIDRLLADPELAPHIDPERVGAAGFSLGGYSVLASAGGELTFADRRSRCEQHADNPVCSLPPEAGFSVADIETLAASDPVFMAAVEREAQATADERVRAAYVIAPAFLSLMDERDLSSVNIPLRFVLAENDQQIHLRETSDAITTNLPTATTHRVPKAGHYVFLAPCSLRGRLFLDTVCADPSGVDRHEVHRHIGADAVRFFREHL